MKRIIKVLSVLLMTFFLVACNSGPTPKSVLDELKSTYKGNTGIAGTMSIPAEETVMDVEIDGKGKVIKISMEEEGETFTVIVDIGNNKSYMDFLGQWYVYELEVGEDEDFDDFFEVFDLSKEVADSPDKLKLEDNVLIAEAPDLSEDIIGEGEDPDTLKIYVEDKQVSKIELLKNDEIVMSVENIRKIDFIEIPEDAISFDEFDFGF